MNPGKNWQLGQFEMTTVHARVLAVLSVALSTTGAVSQAHADVTAPRLGGDVIFRLGYDGVYDAPERLAETNDVFGVMIASPELRFGNGLTLGSEIRFEALLPPTDDRFFDEEGFFLRELYLRYELTDTLTLQFGKYAPSFALASLVTPGMYGNNYSKEIELIDRIGATVEYTFGAMGGGQYLLSASAFFEDTSFLSGSLGFSRGTNERADGGASNTETFESFALSLQGSDFDALPGLTYKIGLLHQARGADGTADENGMSLSVMRIHNLGSNRSLSWIAEVAPIWNIAGTQDDIVYTSLALAYRVSPWTFIASGTSRRRDLAAGGTFDDYNLQTSVEYDFGKGLSLALAHEFLRDQNTNSRRIGVRLSKVIGLGQN